MKKHMLFGVLTASALALIIAIIPPALSDAGSPQSELTFTPAAVQSPPPPPLKFVRGAPNALVIVVADNLSQMRQAIAAVEQQQGRAVHLFPTHALIAFVPTGAELRLIGTAGIEAVYRSWVAEESLAGYGVEAQHAAYAWNHNFVQPAPAPTPVPGAPTPMPLVGDLFEVELPAEETAQPGPPRRYEVSKFMAGSVAVGIILPESNGRLDPSTEDWSDERISQVIAEVQQAMNWWAGQNAGGALSFTYDIHTRVRTRYEPINRPVSDDDLWISDTLARLGYQGSDWREQTFDYLNAIRGQYGTDWAAVAFVVDSYNDEDKLFPGGYFAYTYGWLIVMTYDNDGWQIGNMDSVMAHEFAHNFGAGDEYCLPGYACCRCGEELGYLDIPNSNCAAGCDHYPDPPNGACDGDDAAPNSSCRGCPSCVEIECLMRQGATSSGLCPVSQYQVGMRDLDGDGIPDPVDAQPSISIEPQLPDQTCHDTLTIAGQARVVAYPSPTGRNVNINRIARVLLKVDEGEWQPAAAVDGAFDEARENYTCTTVSLSAGPHTVWIGAYNRFGTWSAISHSFSVLENCPPTNGTITPNSGGAPAGQIVYFTSTYFDQDGNDDLKACRLHVGRVAAPKSLIGNAVLLYQARTNKIMIRNDRGTRWWGGKVVGSANVVQNSQAKVYCNLTTVSRSGNTITVRWAVEFKPAFRGRTKMYLKARDLAGLTSNLQQKGTWTVE